MILVLEKIDLKQSLKKDAYNEKMSYFETVLENCSVLAALLVFL